MSKDGLQIDEFTLAIDFLDDPRDIFCILIRKLKSEKFIRSGNRIFDLKKK